MGEGGPRPPAERFPPRDGGACPPGQTVVSSSLDFLAGMVMTFVLVLALGSTAAAVLFFLVWHAVEGRLCIERRGRERERESEGLLGRLGGLGAFWWGVVAVVAAGGCASGQEEACCLRSV